MKRRYTISNFMCTECEFIIPLPRRREKQREKGHIKDIYCPNCKTKRKFREIRYVDIYKTLDGEVIYN